MKKNHYTKFFNDSINDAISSWNEINNIINKISSKSDIYCIKTNNNVITKPLVVVNNFNNYFSTSAWVQRRFQQGLQQIFWLCKPLKFFFIQPVTTLKKEKNISSPGNNKIWSVKMTRIPSPHITVYLLDLFSEWFGKVVFPD